MTNTDTGSALRTLTAAIESRQRRSATDRSRVTTTTIGVRALRLALPLPATLCMPTGAKTPALTSMLTVAVACVALQPQIRDACEA